MFPVLLHLGPITLHSYGFLLGLGFVTGLHLVQYLATEEEAKRFARFGFYCLIAGLSGSRLLQVIVEWDDFSYRPWEIFKIWEARAFIGGFIVGVPFVIAYIKFQKLEPWRMSDLTMIGIASSQIVGRIGCFAAGCCHGIKTDGWYGIAFDSPFVEQALRGVRVHPTQLYEASIVALITGLMIVLWKRLPYRGFSALSYFLLYPVARFFIEFVRGDSDRGTVLSDTFSTSQLVSMVMFVIAAGVTVYRIRMVRKLQPVVQKKAA